MAERNEEERALLDAYGQATRPSSAQVERALTRTLARIESEERGLPRRRRRVVWALAASVAALMIATAAVAGVRWFQARSRPKAEQYGAARLDRAQPEPGSAQALERAPLEAAPGGSSSPAKLSEPALEQAEFEQADEQEDEQAEVEQRPTRSSRVRERSAEPEPEPGDEGSKTDEADEADETDEADEAEEPASPAADASTLAEESRLLARARRALDQDDFEGALDWAEEHARRHPEGALSEERLILEAVAACRGGSRERGLAAVSTLRERFPGTPALAKVERACADSDPEE